MCFSKYITFLACDCHLSSPSFHTEDDSKYDPTLFQGLDTSKSIIFTVRAPNNAHIGFNAVDEFYEIVISGWSNTKSVIRRKAIGNLHGPAKASALTGGILDANEDLPFWADALNGLVRFGKGNIIGQNVVLQWQDPNPIIPNSVGFMTGWTESGAGGDWNLNHLGEV